MTTASNMKSEGPGVGAPGPENRNPTPNHGTEMHAEDYTMPRAASPCACAVTRLGQSADDAMQPIDPGLARADGDEALACKRRDRPRVSGLGRRPRVRGRFALTFERLSDGRVFQLKGQTARALKALHDAGDAGVTAIECSAWAFRLAAYCFDLRRHFELDVATLREGHEGGWHGRHVLRSPVRVVAVEVSEGA
jgi:hypothetical protein